MVGADAGGRVTARGGDAVPVRLAGVLVDDEVIVVGGGCGLARRGLGGRLEEDITVAGGRRLGAARTEANPGGDQEQDRCARGEHGDTDDGCAAVFIPCHAGPWLHRP